MTDISYESAGVSIREAILEAHRDTWRRIARPGSWFDGQTRVAIAAESRNAPGCALCAERKAALSPYSVEGTHDSLGSLPAEIVEIVHRIITDPARLREQWYQGILAGGMADTEYVEIVGVICSTVSVDTFAHAMGLPNPDLPPPESGVPSRRRPSEVKPGRAWVPWIAPEDASGPEADLYDLGTSNIRRALSSVPDEQRCFFNLVNTQYLSGTEITDFDTDYRAITRAQIELIAGRVSALNQCVY
jgi:hypothetical protein